MNFTKVPGRNRGKVLIYALSTCGWCKKTKQFLKDNGIEYSYVDVDLLQGDERDKIVKEVERWNPSLSFPTIVINDSLCVVGFDERKLRETLKI
ncbi:MAG: glutaredoxin family protein [Thermoplasmata archaeon]|nr:glutaredoxin family protein [Thermoplasmata archaeon]